MLSTAPGVLGRGQEASMGESSGSETKRISGFISPVSRVVDGTISLGACLSSTLCPCLWIRHNPHPLGARGGGGALVQCTTCTAAHGRLASLSPTAEPTLEFYVLWKLLYSLGPSLSLFFQLPGGEGSCKSCVLCLHILLTTRQFSNSLCCWQVCLDSGRQGPAS